MSSDSAPIVAAGGLVERRTDDGVAIAVIRRARYGDEWSLPKGKHEAGEELLDTALREVEEETGRKATVTGFAGTTRYDTGSGTKIVFFWRMTAQGACDLKPPDEEEVRALAWLSPMEAQAKLTHTEEQLLVNRTYTRELGEMEPLRRRFWRWLGGVLAQRRRLEGTLLAYEQELGMRIARDKGQNAASLHSASAFLDQAKAALAANKLDASWKCLVGAQRAEIFALDAQALRSRAAALRIEAVKLNAWRRAAVEKILGPDKDAPTPAALYEASLIKDEHFHNVAYKDVLVRDQFVRLVLFLISGIVVLGVLLARTGAGADLLSGEFNNTSDPWILPLCLTFGYLGAGFSALMTVPTSAGSTRIPELVAGRLVTVGRFFMGVISACLMYVLMRSELGTEVLPKVLVSAAEDSPLSLYFVAFAAGFSERLLVNALGKVAGGEAKK